MILDSKKTKELEEVCVRGGTEHIELMTRAGAAVARRALKSFEAGRKSVAVLCGRGHNGGDGFAAATVLAKNGAKVRILLTHGYPNADDDITLFGEAERAGIKCLLYTADKDRNDFFKTLDIADIIIDGVCGTGFRGELDDELKTVFARVNSSRAKVIAIDIPSGVYADSGSAADGAVCAAATVTFTSKKPCHVIYPGAEKCGKVYVADIGIDCAAVPMSDAAVTEPDFQGVRLCFPPRKSNTNKGDYGRLLAICGSEYMPGAAVFAVKAAARTGVGLIKNVISEKCISAVAAHTADCTYLGLKSKPEYLNETDRIAVVDELEKADVCLIGCGMGLTDRTRQLVRLVIESANIPLIIDADAINCISEDLEILKSTKTDIIITPHPGEMGRLIGKNTGYVQSNRLRAAKGFAADYGVTVVLKGAGTIISLPNGKVYVNSTGNPGMSKGGSGDALAGIIAALRAQKMTDEDAAACGVYIHGECGDRAAARFSVHAMTPFDIISKLSELFSELER